MGEAYAVKFKNERAFKGAMRRKSKMLSDMRPALSEALDYMEAAVKEKTQERQNETISVGSRPFRPLDPKYAATKKKKWGFKPILIASGKMVKGNWYQKILEPMSGILKYVAPAKQKLIAMAHQAPVKFPKRRRRWFGFRGGDRQEVALILRKRLAKAVKA